MNAFHARVYGFTAPASQLGSYESGTQHDFAQHPTSQDEGDDLGYYPDGNKRTLTDDQIAMFRHSEIYSVLRGQQVREENKLAEGDNGSDRLESDSEPKPPQKMPLEDGEELELNVDRVEENHGNSGEYPRTGSKLSSVHSKRKRNDSDGGGRNGKAFTSRRLARELDSATVEDYVLDYGDESTGEEPATHAHPKEADTENEGKHERKSNSISGRKIWWPMLQGPEDATLNTPCV